MRIILTLNLILSVILQSVNAQNAIYKNELNDPCILKLYSEDGPYSKYNASSEIIDKRTENSKTFQNNDGSYTALMTAGPMHYFENGKWNTSSNEVLNDNSLPSFIFSNTHNKFKTYYGNINSGVCIKDLVNSYKISGIKLYNAAKNELTSVVEINPSINPTLFKSSSVSYNIDSKYSYEIEQLTNKLKSQYIINSNVFSTYDATYFIGFEELLSFTAPVNIKNNVDKNDGVIFLQNDKEILSYSDLFYYSSLRGSSSEQEKADFKVIKINNTTYKIITFIPIAWLQNSTTKYPVVIDPTITCVPTNAAYWTGTTGNNGSATNTDDKIKVGFYDCAGCTDVDWRPYAKIDISALPDNACISNATYNMYQNVWNNGSGNDGLRFDIGWANVEPVSASWTAIGSAIDNLAERYATWDVWGTPGACSGCNGGWDFNEACCGWENFNIDYSLFRNRNKNVLCSNYITIGLDLTYRASDCGTCFGSETNELEFASHSNANRPQLAITYTNTTAGDPATFGTNQWNAYAYACGNIDLVGSTYAGFYPETALSYNSTSKWASASSPSTATGYSGACVDIDNHILVSKRQGFPCGVYQINIPSHDDDARVYINGTNVWQHIGGCCDAHTNIWTGYLGSTSTIEYRHQEGGGGSNQEISFTNVITALNGGTIGGIANPTSICVGGDPGAFTSTADASGGTIGITNGSPAAPVYQWERAPTNTFGTITNVGTSSTTFDPDATLAVGTYFFRRKVTDACGTVAYSNIIQVNVVADPVMPTATKSPNNANVCAGQTLTLSGVTDAGGGSGTCNLMYRYNNGSGFSAWSTTLPSFAAVTGTNIIELRKECSGTGCDNSSSNVFSWVVTAQIVAPTLNTPSIASGTAICQGQNVSATINAGSGGAGASDVYEFSTNGGTSWSAYTSGATINTSSATTSVQIRVSRTAGTGTGCNAVGPNVIATWPVTIQPIAPTLNIATPTIGAICQGQNVSATITAGSGGTGASDVYEFSTNGGTSWSAYTSGTIINTSSATGSVQIRVSRTAGTGSGCNTAGPNIIATWPVNTPSVAPISIIGTTTICNGGSTTLTLSGGSAGTGAVAEWFSGSCGSTVIGTGNSITVSPVTNTTYFVRYNGTCNTTTCASTTVTVNTLSVAPTSITGTTTICNGGSTTLTLSGGTAGTGAVAEWFSGSCGSTVVGTGNSITVSPTTNTTYFVRYNGTCNTTTCANATVTVNTLSTAPTGITGTTNICNGGSTTLTLSGGTAGTGAVAEWFSGSCGSTVIGTGNSITVSPTTNTTYFVRYNGTCNTTTCASATVTVNTLSTAPTGITGTTTICNGASTTLTLSGGSAGTGAVAEWFSGSCGSTVIGTGNSITVSPVTNTTYFVRYNGTCNTTTCASATVTVNTLSVAPTSITGTTTICNGGSTTLTLSGGSTGTGAVAEWFSGSCGGTSAGTGNSITVSPTSTTTYFVRYNGTCNTTTCASATVTVNTLSVAPTSITGTTTICNGGSTTLTLSGGSAGTGAVAEWFSGSCGSTVIGTGNSITVSPTTNTTYFVRYNGTCNTTTCASATVTVNTLSIAPTGITGTTTICNGASTTLTLSGGTAGTGATAEWFAGSCGSTVIGTGNSIIVSPTSTTTYFVRYNGTCNTTTCASATVTVNTLSVAATSTTSTPDHGCEGTSITLTASGFTSGTGATPTWWTGPGGTGTNVGTGSSVVTTIISPTYYMRLDGTCNSVESVVNVSMGGSSNVILASGPSTNPIAYCEDGLWTYYEHPSLPGKFVFAIKWGTTNTVAKAAAQVFIQNNATTISNEATRAGGIKDASYVMKRYWNVDLGGNTLVSPVDVKFYYDPAEISAMTTARDSELTLLNTITPGGYYPVSFSWFKTVGIPFSPSLINDGNNFGFSNIRLTPSVSGTESGVNYVEFDGITSFSGGTGGIGISPYAGVGLPVTYTSITAKPIDNEYIQVSWITASEINNKGFEVLRSLDGINFEKVGFVNGNNNSTTAHTYHFDDHNVVAGREYYYRLNQVDNNGKKEESKIVSSIIHGNTSIIIGELYPNPTSSNASVDITVFQNTSVRIKMIDAIGKQVINTTSELVTGTNKINLNMSHLSEGVYIVSIQVGEDTIQKRIIITK